MPLSAPASAQDCCGGVELGLCRPLPAAAQIFRPQLRGCPGLPGRAPHPPPSSLAPRARAVLVRLLGVSWLEARGQGGDEDKFKSPWRLVAFLSRVSRYQPLFLSSPQRLSRVAKVKRMQLQGSPKPGGPAVLGLARTASRVGGKTAPPGLALRR